MAFTPAGVELIVKGLGPYLGDLGKADKAQQNLGNSAASAGSKITASFGNILRSGAIARIGAKAIDGAIGIISGSVNGLISVTGQALDEFAKYERLSLSIQSLTAREISQGQVVEQQKTVMAQLTAKENEELQGLTQSIEKEILQRDTLSARIQEQKETVRQMTDEWTDQGLVTKTAQARLAEMELQYSTSGTEIDRMKSRVEELNSKNGELITVTEKVRTGQMSMAEAMQQAGPKAQELLRWITALAIASPFNEEGVAQAFKTALAYGFTTKEAKRLTEAELDFAAATGQSVDATQHIALALGQMQAKGKVSGQELIQLTNAGIGVNKILEGMGFTLDDVSNGLVDADKFIEAVIVDMEVFKGVGKEQATTFSGLIASLQDLKAIGLREFFGGTFRAIQPYLTNFVAGLTDAALTSGSIGKLGDVIGQKVGGALGRVSTIIGKVQGAFDRFGARGATISILGILGLEPEQIATVLSTFDKISAGLDKVQGAFDRFGIRGATISILGILGLEPEQIATVLGTFNSIVEGINTFVQNIRDAILAFQNVGVEGEGGVLSTLFNVESFNELAGKILLAIPEMLSQIVTAITSFLATQGPVITETVGKWSETFWEWVNTVVAGAGTALAAIIVAVAAWATSAESQTQLNSLGVTLGELLVDGVALAMENQEQVGLVMTKIVAGLGLAALAIAGTLIVIGGQLAAGIISGILSKLGIDLKPALFSELGGILSGIVDNLLTIIRLVWGKIGTAIIDAIIVALQAGLGLNAAIIGTLQSMVDGVMSFLGIASPSTLFFDFGVDIIQGLINGILSLAGSVLTAITGIFGGEEQPTLDLAPMAESNILLTTTISLISQIAVSLTNIATVIVPMTTEAFTVFYGAISPFLLLINETLTLTIQLLTTIASTSLPTVMTSSQTTTQAMIVGFTVVNAILTKTISLLTQISTNLTSVASNAKKAVDAMMDFEDAHDPLEELIGLVNEATDAFEGMANAARDAADAASSAGSASAAKTGIGFSRGIGFAAGTMGFEVPSGFPNDSFPMRVESGEKVLVTPRGMSIEQAVASHYPQITTKQQPAITFGNIYVTNGMDVAMLQNVIRQTVAESFG